MSFTNKIKNELVNIELTRLQIISELSGLLKNSLVEDKNLKISTENSIIAKFLFQLLKKQFDIYIHVSVRKGYNYNKNYIYTLVAGEKLSLINKELSLNYNIPDSYLIDDFDLKCAYLRGVFMACGSINDPKTARYHMEFSFNNLEYSEFINDLLNSYDLNSKILHRENRYIVYVKESEKIGDFLRIVGATNALLYYENVKIYRSRKNELNRINNCEQANVDKIIQTAKNQVDDINFIKDNDLIDVLDDKLKIVCDYRIRYPEVSLVELSEIISIETGEKLTKSGLYHRLDKLKKISQKLREKSKFN